MECFLVKKNEHFIYLQITDFYNFNYLKQSKNNQRKRFRKIEVENFNLVIRKSVLYLHSQYRNIQRYWRVGRVVECGSLENC